MIRDCVPRAVVPPRSLAQCRLAPVRETAGDAPGFIDVKDTFLRCFEVAPERFRWRKHLIANYKTLSKALRDFEGRHPSLLLKTEDGLSRQLSKEGIGAD